jgi:glycerol transport system ATP-binding protein
VAGIQLQNLSHHYTTSEDGEPDYALENIDLSWEDGGAYALLGPSGCGKTTLLNAISGLLRPSAGQVLFNGEDVTPLPPERRNIAQVFQFPVVYDSMTVADNLAFPLRNRGVARAECERRVRETLAMLELEDVAARKARNLPADVKQKISLGRGLVRDDANAILFDEPLTVIDPALKWRLRAQLKKVHQQFRHTMVYVTHDQTEALTFADRVVVMLDGRVLQIATPEELFSAPAHTFVGRFIGSPGMNVLPCRLEGGVARVDEHQLPLNVPPTSDGELELGIRPEHIDLVEAGTSEHALPVSITGIEDHGRFRSVRVQLAQHSLKVILPENSAVPLAPAMLMRPEHIHLYRDSLLLKRAGNSS